MFEPNPTQPIAFHKKIRPNPTHGWTQPIAISGLTHVISATASTWTWTFAFTFSHGSFPKENCGNQNRGALGLAMGTEAPKTPTPRGVWGVAMSDFDLK